MLIETLRQIQGRDRLTDNAMAAKLNIHPISWNRLKKGRSNPHDYRFLTNAVRAYPVELGLVIVREMLGDSYETVLPEMLKDIIAGMRKS